MLYGGKILYICYMVDCTGGAITWQMQCQAHAVKATMDDFFWWKLQVQIQLQIQLVKFFTKFNVNKITYNKIWMTLPLVVLVICSNMREKKSISIKSEKMHASKTHKFEALWYWHWKCITNDGDPKVSVADGGSNELSGLVKLLGQVLGTHVRPRITMYWYNACLLRNYLFVLRSDFTNWRNLLWKSSTGRSEDCREIEAAIAEETPFLALLAIIVLW